MTEPERFNPEMFQLARELRDWTQSELAVRSGFTQGYISQVEHGDREPTPEKTERFAATLNVPREFFFQPDRLTGIGLSLMFYRKRSTAQVRHLRRLQADANVRRIQVSRLLRGFDLRTRNTFTKMDIDDHDGDAERIAQFVRGNWGMAIGPVRNLVDEIEAAGGLVFKFPFGTNDIDAMSQWPDDSPPLFFINSTAPADRIRFSLAHELAHVVMHRAASETMETEADRFAAEFLMPVRDIGADLVNMTITLAAALKPKWRTSMAAIIRRSRDAGKLDPTSYTALCRRMSALGYRKREPGPIAHEEPRLVPTLLQKYQQINGYTVADLARLSRVHESDFEAMFIPKTGMRMAK